MKPIGSKELLKLRLISRLIQELEDPGEDTGSDDASEYQPGIDRGDIRDFYLPRVQKNWYYDPSVFCKLLGIR
jgi:hypothetical protein